MLLSQAAHVVRSGRGPLGLYRIDPPRILGEQWHAHLDAAHDGGAINSDGTWKHGNGMLTKAQARFLRSTGWDV